MTCGGCASRVSKAIHSLDAAAKIDADPVTRVVTVKSQLPRQNLEAALTSAGYAPNEESPTLRK
ncbi:heavy-metal-associated domain-containing protein [Thalassovita aquimarina]|nr:heavy-metal-associated domain-containing protein [Thalassovita aquimarina]